eukprot:SAG31_NODE_23156_length_510_cov_0.722628_1_plen_98_part_00
MGNRSLAAAGKAERTCESSAAMVAERARCAIYDVLVGSGAALTQLGETNHRTEAAAVERGFTVLAMLIGAFVFSIVVGSISEVIRNSNPGDTVKNGP